MKKRIFSFFLAVLMAAGLFTVTANAAVLPGSGTSENPYTISNLEELKAFRDSVNSGNKYSDAKVKLLADIYLGGSENPWTPIGTDKKSFWGEFDGNGHRITGLYVNGSYRQGFFGYLDGNIVNLDVEGTANGNTYVGGVVGYNAGYVGACTSNVKVSASLDGGGIVGMNSEWGTVSQCLNKGDVSGSNGVGGITGNNEGVVENCGNVGNVSGGEIVGGGVGIDNGAKVGSTNRCYTIGTVSGSSNVGAICGLQPLSEDEYQERVVYCISLNGVSEASRKNPDTFKGLYWNFTDIWAIDEKFGAPVPKAIYERSAFSPDEGGTYYFDLSSFEIPGTLNTSLPDTSLHYVPFTYAGAVDSYNVIDGTHASDEYAATRRASRGLLMCEYNVTREVCWNDLRAGGFAYGNSLSQGGLDLILRMPSVGSYKRFESLEETEAGLPIFNEWDAITAKGIDIKNFYKEPSWGQDAGIISGLHGLRAKNTQNVYGNGYDDESKSVYNGYVTIHCYRPLIEIKDSNTLGLNSLKEVTLDLNGGSLGGESSIKIIVKRGAEFSAPASEGLTAPENYTTKGLKWLGNDGNLYSPGESVPAEVYSLKAQWPYYEQFSLEVGETYYFDLTSLGFGSYLDRANADLADKTLHYTPFVYAGTVNATKYGSGKYYHSLFIAENNIFTGVSHEGLCFDTGKNLIYGTDYSLNNISYQLRAPSVGKKGDSNNEWDKILAKGDYINNCGSVGSVGQEELEEDDISPGQQAEFGGTGAIVRGASSNGSRDYVTSYAGHGYRPVLEITGADALSEDSLKAVKLSFVSEKFDGREGINIVVKNGESFKAPPQEGLSVPEEFSEDGALRWLDDDGVLYAPGESVPASVTYLRAQWTRSNGDFDFVEEDGALVITRCNVSRDEITVPESINGLSVKAIASGAFSNKNEVQNVIISEGIETIYENAFSDCTAVKTIYIPSTAKDIPENIISDKTGVTLICRECTEAQKFVMNNGFNYETVSEILPKGTAHWSRTHFMTLVVPLSSKGDLNEIMSFDSNAVVVKTPSYKSGDVEIFGTGSRISSTMGKYGTVEYTVVILGDINGDGVCDVLDAQLSEGYLSKKTFDGNTAAEIAATYDRGGEMTVEDYSRIVNTALGGEE